MDTKSFYTFYNLEELDIKDIYLDENNYLNIVLIMPIHMDYIGNGLRSEFDYTKVHKFIFKEVQVDKPFHLQNKIKISSYHLTSDNWISLIVNDQKILFR